MSFPNTKLSDVELDRQRLIKELVADNGDQWLEQYKPGSFGCHELLDRTSIVAAMVEQYLLTHPACVQNPNWYALVERVVSSLNELYQQIGTESSVESPMAEIQEPNSNRERERVIDID